MLDYEEDVLPMIEQGARNFREKALFATQYEGGFRGQELYDLTVGDVVDHEDGVYIHENGKTGSREVLLIGDAVAYFTDWLEREHPAPKDPVAPLSLKLSAPERASYQTFLKYFKRAAARAGVKKNATPTNFRKSNAYDLARRGFNAALIEERQGRRRGSEAVARYNSRFGREADDQYLSGHGVDPGEDPENDPRPVECTRCGQETPRHKGRCSNCRLPFDPLEAYEKGSRTTQEPDPLGLRGIFADLDDEQRERAREDLAALLGLDGNQQDGRPMLAGPATDVGLGDRIYGPVEAERVRRI